METSQTLKEFAAAFAKAQGEMKNAPKKSENPFFKNLYADLTTIVDTAKPILTKYGFSIIQGLSSEGKTAIISTLLLHSSGEFVRDSLRLDAKDSTPQALGSAFTYGKRYAYAAILGMATDEDDDGNGAQDQKPEQKGNKPESKTCPPEVAKEKQKVLAILEKLGIKSESMSSRIMEAQKLLQIKGEIKNFTLEDWEKILYHFNLKLKEKGQK